MATTQSEIIGGAYKRVHKRFDPLRCAWEDYEPDSKKSDLEGVVFNFIYNQQSASPYAKVGSPKVVEVLSPALKNTLKRCLPFVDAAVDSDVTGPNLEVDARTLAAHEEMLHLELLRLQSKLEKKQETSSDEEVDINKRASLTTFNPENENTLDTDEVDQTEETSSTAVEIDHLKKLLFCIDTEFSSTKRRFKDLIGKRDITYDLLWWLFPQDCVIIFKDPASELIIAGRITASFYQTSQAQKYFSITVKYIDNDGTKLFYRMHRINIFSFQSHITIDSLGAQPLDDPELRQFLTERGRKFVQLYGQHYLEYHDFLLTRGTFNQLIKFRAVGRAMVDGSSYRRMNGLGDDGHRQPEGNKVLEVSEDELVLCASTVPGYSFVRKRWGLLLADKFSPIVWNKNAFDHLVLPAGIKELIQSLVRADRHNAAMIKDVIAGKGGGCILVLHGRPGTGKTLTAEAVAEQQEKPLLNISVGDLGTDASQLESKLTEFFELASLWDAVLLVDEADVFMEARSLHELKRNAMVGVFLRVLEYQQQIMFLSTNRINTFDEAFRSRMSVAIQYRDLDESARRTVWENFLKVADVKIVPSHIAEDKSVAYVTTEQLDRLASKVLNGREIKNTMRTAQALSSSSGKRLGYDLLLNVLELVKQFDVAKKDE